MVVNNLTWYMYFAKVVRYDLPGTPAVKVVKTSCVVRYQKLFAVLITNTAVQAGTSALQVARPVHVNPKVLQLYPWYPLKQ